MFANRNSTKPTVTEEHPASICVHIDTVQPTCLVTNSEEVYYMAPLFIPDNTSADTDTDSVKSK